MVRVCTVNIGTLVGKRREVVEMLARRRVDICCIQEVRYKNQGTTAFGSNEEKYKFWYKGNAEGTNGVGLLVKQDLAERVLEVERFSDRVMKIKILLGKVVCHVFSAYAPQAGRTAQEKDEFWELLEEEVARVPNAEGLIVGGDLNGHVGTNRDSFSDIMGPYGFGTSNREGTTILEFCKHQNLRILNTYFKKDKYKTVTYASGGSETQVDLVLMRPREEFTQIDCRAIPGECCATQHRPVRADIRVSTMKRRKVKGRKKIKAWKLKDEELRRNFEARLEGEFQAIGDQWTDMQNCVQEVCREVCGVTSGARGRERETWWWCAEVQSTIKAKKVAFKSWQATKTQDDKEIYRMRNREAKRAVAHAKRVALDAWCEDLNSAEGKRKMFAMAKQMKKNKKDIIGGYYVKGENGEIATTEEGICERWRSYFNDLLNEENPNEIEEVECVEGPIIDVTEEEVRVAIRSMKANKAPGPSGISSDIFKHAGNAGIKQLTKAFQNIMNTEVCPEEWKDSTTVPIYKGKGDPLQCGKYRGLRMLEHGMKIWEKVLDRRLKSVIDVGSNQFGFTATRSTTDAIFILRQIQQKYNEKKRKLYHIFVDLEKAFDRVPHRAIQWALRRQRVPERLVRQVMALYVGSRSCVAAAGGVSNSFEVTVGVHQGSALSPLLFNLVMEEATKHCRRGVPWDVLYADDLAITAETREEAVEEFITWKSAMECRGLKVNIEKTKLLVSGGTCNTVVQTGRYPCGVCGRGVGVNSVLCGDCGKWVHQRCSGLQNVRLARNFVCPACIRLGEGDEDALDREDIVLGPREEDVVREVETFCYLGDVVDRECGAERAINMRVAAGWSKWREIAGLLCNKHIPLKNRARVYDACIRSVIVYGAETWPLTQRLETIICGCDRRMLRYMAGVSLRDRVRSAEVAQRCGLQQMEEILRARRLSWFGHVVRRPDEDVLSEVVNMEVDGRRPRGRPKKTWLATVEEDLRHAGLDRELAQDREEWRRAIARLTPQHENT